MFCFSVIVNSWSLERLLSCVEKCKIVFCSKYLNAEVRHAHAQLTSHFKELGQVPFSDGVGGVDYATQTGVDTTEQLDVDASEEKQLIASARKPFGAFFAIKLDKVVPCCDPSYQDKNPLYQPQFLDKLTKNWLPLCPFWSSILRGITSTCAIVNSALKLRLLYTFTQATLPDTESGVKRPNCHTVAGRRYIVL